MAWLRIQLPHPANKAIKFEVILKLSDFSLFFSNRLHFLSAAKIDP